VTIYLRKNNYWRLQNNYLTLSQVVFTINSSRHHSFSVNRKNICEGPVKGFYQGRNYLGVGTIDQ
jgi:hypothetical protein